MAKSSTQKPAPKPVLTTRSPVKNPYHPPTKAIAIVGLVLNIAIFPGLGTVIGGRTKTGVTQIVLTLVSILLDLTIIGLIIGIPLGVGVWVWSIISGVRLMQDAKD